MCEVYNKTTSFQSPADSAYFMSLSIRRRRKIDEKKKENALFIHCRADHNIQRASSEWYMYTEPSGAYILYTYGQKGEAAYGKL